MKCPNCKKMIQSSDKFCWHCGCPITQNDGRPKWIVPSVIFGSVVLASAIYFGANYFGPQSFQQSTINSSVAPTSVSTQVVSALPPASVVPTLRPIPSATTIPPTPTNIPLPTPSPTAVPTPTSNPNTISQLISYVDDKDKSLWIWDPQTDKSTKFANKVSTYQWSPTGDKIAYFAENGIFVMDLRSKEVVLLGGGYYETYTWSPDGIQLVFSEGCKVHLIDSNGANKRLLYDLNEGGSGGGGEISKDLIDEYLRGQRQFWTRGPIAYWSDDGTKIAIVLAIGRCRNHVLSINANGSSAKTCSYIMDCKALLPKSSTIDPYLGYSSSSPVFIKNEDGALFQYKYDGLSIAEDAGGWPQPDIWVLDVRKRGTIMYNWGFHNNIWITTTIGTEKRITSQPTFKNQGMITKDGKWIVFTETTVKNGRLDSVGGAFDADLTVNIIAMNIETGFTKKINAQSNAVNPAWQFPARSIK